MARANSAAIKLDHDLPGATFIGLLYARSEVVEAEADAVDRKRLTEGSVGYSDLYQALISESRTLGEVILRQRPTCLEDAAILAHHAYCAIDLIDGIGMDDDDQDDRKARREITTMLHRAVQLLFCYLADAAPIEPESVGPVFAMSVEHARKFQSAAAHVEGPSHG